MDKSPPGSFGFVCEAPKHPCQDPELNDCASDATCEPNGPLFNCKCKTFKEFKDLVLFLGLSGFVDKSTDKSRPGRICVREIPVCEDPNRNDCHPKATCLSLNGTNYNCSCLEGYLDKSPTKRRPGRVCVELVSFKFVLCNTSFRSTSV